MKEAKETSDTEAINLSRYQTEAGILGILHSMRTVAVVGLSANELRASHFVGFYLKNHGYHVVPVNPREKMILGATSYASLKDIPFAIDVVNVFRAPAAVPGIATEAVEIGAKCLWLQFGVISPEGIAIAEEGGMELIVDRCIKIEHARHMGRMHWLGFNTGRVTSRRGTLQ